MGLGPVCDTYEPVTVRVLSIFLLFLFCGWNQVCETVKAGTHQRGKILVVLM